MDHTIIINFAGGIISPGTLLKILITAERLGIRFVRFGLRQQILVDLAAYNMLPFTQELDSLKFDYEVDVNKFPNIISSYPAQEIFIKDTWLKEGVYKDILGDFDFKPTVKVNICDKNQSFTPMLTGNINWIASSDSDHYWHLVVRFPKTNIIYEWDKVCYTNHIAQFTKILDQIIVDKPDLFIDNPDADGARLFSLVNLQDFILKPAETRAPLSSFNLPYYEGLNRYDDKYWLGIYRRDELFSIEFLKQVCQLCLDTKLGQLCCTSWKTIIIKRIEEKDKASWNTLLEEFGLNMRHAANELNFQVEDNCIDGLELKHFLVKYFNNADIRTFGLCFGIKTRKKSEVFSSILIRKRYFLNFFGLKIFPVYDILCAKDFNPNERTGEVFSTSNPRFILPEQVRRSILKYHQHRRNSLQKRKTVAEPQPAQTIPRFSTFLYQCITCLTVYNEQTGEPANNIPPGTSFDELPEQYCCSICEGGKNNFAIIDQVALKLL